MKNVKIELTPAEYCVLSDIAKRVFDCMEYDELLNAYSDGSRFIFSCNKHELNALKRAVEKL
jgi:hypothetical protein